MPSANLPPEIRAMIEQRFQRVDRQRATELAEASMRHAARECARICETVEDQPETYDFAHGEATECAERCLTYAASLAEETMLPERESA